MEGNYKREKGRREDEGKGWGEERKGGSDEVGGNESGCDRGVASLATLRSPATLTPLRPLGRFLRPVISTIDDDLVLTSTDTAWYMKPSSGVFHYSRYLRYLNI